MREFRIASQELRIIVDRVDHDIDVSESRATRRARFGNTGPGLKRYIGKVAVPQILVEQLALGIAGFSLQLLDLRIDVAVADQDVGPSVVIHVEEAAAPTQELRVRS